MPDISISTLKICTKDTYRLLCVDEGVYFDDIDKMSNTLYEKTKVGLMQLYTTLKYSERLGIDIKDTDEVIHIIAKCDINGNEYFVDYKYFKHFLRIEIDNLEELIKTVK